MPERPPSQPTPRARALAELSLDGLIERADELARRWAIALIDARPLGELGALPLQELAREAPALCAQALRAVQSDVELERLTGEGRPSGREGAAAARRIAAICGSHEPAVLARSAEALRGVLWEALLVQLPEPSARLLGDLADRLAHVCSAALAAALQATPAAFEATPAAFEATPAAFEATTGARVRDEWRERDGEQRRAREVGRAAERVAAEARVAHEHPSRTPLPPEHVAATAPGVPPPGASLARAVIVDELAPAPARAGEQARPPAHAAAREAAVEPAGALHAEIAIRDRRREEGPAAWIGSIGAQLERFAVDGLPFAVLLVELAELGRAPREEPPDELARAAAQMERALVDVLGAWPGSLTRERAGRCWVVAPGTDRAAAGRLAQRLIAGVAARASDRGAPLAIAVGAAVCPDDASETSALAAQADLALYAARAAARTGPSAGEHPA